MYDQALTITIIISLLNLDGSLPTNSQIDERTMATMEPKSDLNPNFPNLVQREKIFGVKFWTPEEWQFLRATTKYPRHLCAIGTFGDYDKSVHAARFVVCWAAG